MQLPCTSHQQTEKQTSKETSITYTTLPTGECVTGENASSVRKVQKVRSLRPPFC
jgi:hypothetical protein